ncbi:thioredoxin family protein [Thalassoglobus sp. JC818]|uniref:thioredoxin family protein n=1 Tax=Thalassoglobus sp. JC818 TaxID=3232136 RepID=UPI00345AB668
MKQSTIEIIIGVLLLFVTSSSCDAQHFECTDRAAIEIAEQSRFRSSTFWTGKELQKSWSPPCRLDLNLANHSGGGTTRFQFTEEGIRHPQMVVSGTRQAILTDVIPHEVDHLVRASLIGHPIERWLDEGCATLFESEASKQRLRETACLADPRLITAEWLSALEYPHQSHDVSMVYAVGFSLVEFLLSRDSPQVLLEFQKDVSSIEQRLKAHYRLSVVQLRDAFADWRMSRKRHTMLRCECHNISKPLLVIWTTKWCGPCRQFLHDWHADESFRNALSEKFHIHFLDHDRFSAFAHQHQIKSVPTFQTVEAKFTGYFSKDDLLRRLNIAEEQPSENVEETSVEETVEAAQPEEKAPVVESVEVVPTTSPELVTGSDQSRIQSLTPGTKSPDETSPTKPGKWLWLGYTALQWFGVVGGSAASGGLVGMATVWLLRRTFKTLSASDASTPQPTPTEEVPLVRAPFPRQLDEACELLAIRQSEGRVAVLDALRGMFLEDEIDRRVKIAEPESQKVLQSLMSDINQRVQEVAPLSVPAELTLEN